MFILPHYYIVLYFSVFSTQPFRLLWKEVQTDGPIGERGMSLEIKHEPPVENGKLYVGTQNFVKNKSFQMEEVLKKRFLYSEPV